MMPMRRYLSFILLALMLGACTPRGGPISFAAEAGPRMPPVVQASMEDILASLELVLQANQPGILDKLNPGISDSEIEKIKGELGGDIHTEMQAFYRWHNG